MSELKEVHFIGIGGIGMSALARILMKKGVLVTGSDSSLKGDIIDKLRLEGAILEGDPFDFKGKTVVYSSAISKENEEYKRAFAEPTARLLHRSELLGALFLEQKSLCVTGSHGKTTTSALLTHLLDVACLDPSFAVGGIVENLASNGRHGTGEYFVAEADESDGSFLQYKAFGAIVTNIDKDHIDHWKSEENLAIGFKQFMDAVESKEHLFYCFDDEGLKKISPKGVSYGLEKGADVYGNHVRQKDFSMLFDVEFRGKKIKDIELSLIGRHNVQNALGVLGLGLVIGIEEDKIRRAFKSFRGAGRRMDVKGSASGVLVIDDYAHHPKEIEAFLRALKGSAEGRRIVVVFQPHRYSRTIDCKEEYKSAFKMADLLITTDIYAAGEPAIPGVTGLSFKESLLAPKEIFYCPRQGLLDFTLGKIRPYDIVVTMGAGDVTNLGPDLLFHLKKVAPKKYKMGLLFGGASREHKVSKISAMHVAAALNKEYLDVELFSIDELGVWEHKERPKVGRIAPECLEALQACDLLFPLFHGPYGEDGTIQGFFEMLGIPYVGCDTLSSAICMNKAIAKRLALQVGVKTNHFIDFTRGEWELFKEEKLDLIEKEFSYPFFVKAAHFGSSIGVFKVENKKALIEAVEWIIVRDTLVIIESLVVGRELEFAVLGVIDPLISHPGEILTGGKVYDYDVKYGTNAMATDVYPDVDPEILAEGKGCVKKLARVFGISGLVRIDFFLTADGDWIFNEANTMPGFTPTSLYPEVWARAGLSYTELLDKLVVAALYKGRVRIIEGCL